MTPQQFMTEALNEARRASEIGEVPVGAVLVYGNEIVARAHNETEMRKDATAHAEMLVIERGSVALKNWRLSDTALYVTLEPCTMCIGAMILSRVPSLYFGARDPRLGAVGSLFDLSQFPKFPHKIEVFPELLHEECRSVLSEFFKERRKEG